MSLDDDWLAVGALLSRLWPQHTRLMIRRRDATGDEEPSTLDHWRGILEPAGAHTVCQALLDLAESGDTLDKPLDLALIQRYVRRVQERQRMARPALPPAQPAGGRDRHRPINVRLSEFDEHASANPGVFELRCRDMISRGMEPGEGAAALMGEFGGSFPTVDQRAAAFCAAQERGEKPDPKSVHPAVLTAARAEWVRRHPTSQQAPVGAHTGDTA